MRRAVNCIELDGVTSGELDDLLNVDHGLTPWEVEFIEDMDRKRERTKWFTPRQVEKIRKLWDRHCG